MEAHKRSERLKEISDRPFFYNARAEILAMCSRTYADRKSLCLPLIDHFEVLAGTVTSASDVMAEINEFCDKKQCENSYGVTQGGDKVDHVGMLVPMLLGRTETTMEYVQKEDLRTRGATRNCPGGMEDYCIAAQRYFLSDGGQKTTPSAFRSKFISFEKNHFADVPHPVQMTMVFLGFSTPQSRLKIVQGEVLRGRAGDQADTMDVPSLRAGVGYDN